MKMMYCNETEYVYKVWWQQNTRTHGEHKEQRKCSPHFRILRKSNKDIGRMQKKDEKLYVRDARSGR